MVRTRSGQPVSRSHHSSSSSAYAVILKYQPSICRGVTSESHRQQRPSSTCSLASTVWQEGHQFTVAAFRYARPRSNMRTKMSCSQR